MDYLSGEILCIDKPLGWTSFDAVKRVRGALVRRMGISRIKVGHAGTLDPLATGVMIICTGRATKRIEELQAGIKEYEATIALGATTPSFDLETEVDATYPTGHITREAVEEALRGFTGTIQQVPPVFSACKINGVRAYESARAGEEVEMRPRTIVIESLELLDYAQDAIKVRVVCGKGTYIRSLARDIGVALGSGAHLTALRRTRVGDIAIADCVSVAQAAEIIAAAPVEYPDWYEGKRKA